MSVLALGTIDTRRVRHFVPVLAALVLASCGSGTSTTGPSRSHRVPKADVRGGAPAHVAVILMENEEYENVIGSRSAPYLDSLAGTYALASRMYAITHPSLPNYMALTGGSTFRFTSDCNGCAVAQTSLVDQLDAAHLSWRAYMEDLPHPCYQGPSTGEYDENHDPFVHYTRITSSPSRCAQIVPLTQLSTDEETGRVPRFSWITPNLCHDMHDCSVTIGDRFLSGLVPPLLRALGPRGLLFITFDEGDSDDTCCQVAAGGHIVTILAGGLARRGATLSTPADHYSVLQTIEDLFGLPRLRGAACACTPSLQPLLAK